MRPLLCLITPEEAIAGINFVSDVDILIITWPDGFQEISLVVN